SIAATDSNDALFALSNYGLTSVHLAAPGVNILSTIPGAAYSYSSGTSMAVAHVSGAAALLLSKCSLDTPPLRRLILNNVGVISRSSLGGGTGGGKQGGYAYSWFGSEAPGAAPAKYWLEAVDLKGQSEWYGPFKPATSAKLGNSSASVNPLLPSKLLRELGA